MKFVTINDSLAPIRLLRQVDAIDDAALDRLLSAELAFKRQAQAAGARWLDVIDGRSFSGLTRAQREVCGAWLTSNLALLAEVSLGVAIALPARLEGNGHRLAAILDSAGVATHVGTELESALHWALDRVYDEDVEIAPALVLNGIDALRQTLA